ADSRTPYWTSESVWLEPYLTTGRTLLLLYVLGFVIDPRLAQMLAKLGMRLTQSVVIDPQQHYATDPEMVAVSGLEPHPITKNVSLTFFPGARALELVPTAAAISTVPLIRSSKASYTRPVEPVEARQVSPNLPFAPPMAAESEADPHPHVLAVAAEGMWPGATPDARPLRAVIIGDADFASNSFLP